MLGLADAHNKRNVILVDLYADCHRITTTTTTTRSTIVPTYSNSN